MQIQNSSSKNSTAVTFVKGQRVVACDPEDGFFYPGGLIHSLTNVTFPGLSEIERSARCYWM